MARTGLRETLVAKEESRTRADGRSRPIETDRQEDGAGVKRPGLRVTFVGSLIRTNTCRQAF